MSFLLFSHLILLFNSSKLPKVITELFYQKSNCQVMPPPLSSYQDDEYLFDLSGKSYMFKEMY